MRPDALRSRRADLVISAAAELRERLAAGRAIPLDEAPRLHRDRAEDLVVEIDSGRRDR